MQNEIEVTDAGLHWQAAVSRARTDARHTYLTVNGLRVAVVAPLTLDGTAAPDGQVTEPRKWLYGLTADEWFHLAAEGQDSEVAPCCGDIGELRDWLNALATCQGAGQSWVMCRSVLDAYAVALASHDALASASAFPLLHRVLAGARAELEGDRNAAKEHREQEAGQ